MASLNTIFMLHPSSISKGGWFREELKDLKSQTAMIELMNSRYDTFLRERTKLTNKQIKEANEDTIWFAVEDAKKFGFVDEIK